MKDFAIKTLVLGMVRTNCYIISKEENKEAIIIDPADSADKIIAYLKENNYVCKGILLTHGHFDHILAGRTLKDSTQAHIYAHEEENALVQDANMNCSMIFQSGYSLKPDSLLRDQEQINIAGFQIKVIHTPGHTGGSVCYHFVDQGLLFSGDTLFQQGIGRTDLPTGNGRQLIQSIQEKLFVLEDDIIVYPGHEDTTTIGYEKENNPYVKA